MERAEELGSAVVKVLDDGNGNGEAMEEFLQSDVYKQKGEDNLNFSWDKHLHLPGWAQYLLDQGNKARKDLEEYAGGEYISDGNNNFLAGSNVLCATQEKGAEIIKAARNGCFDLQAADAYAWELKLKEMAAKESTISCVMIDCSKIHDVVRVRAEYHRAALNSKFERLIRGDGKFVKCIWPSHSTTTL